MSSLILQDLYIEGRAAYSPGLAAILRANGKPRFPSEAEAQFRKRLKRARLTYLRDSSFEDKEMSSILSMGSLQTAPDEVLEMEDWEMAPGCIKERMDATSKQISTVAFSKPALSTRTGVQVCDDVFFRVETVIPGETRELRAPAHHMLMVSVAAGKVRVKMANFLGTEFLLGTDGMFKVLPEVGVSVQSVGGSKDAVLHITTLLH